MLLTRSNKVGPIDVYYPSLLRRFISSFVDSGITFIIVGSLVHLTTRIDNDSITLKVAAIILGFSYEPITTLFSRTAGNLIAGIRIQRPNDGLPLSFLKAYLRYIVKSFLGWLSFLTMHQDAQMRAIHDIMADTLVVDEA